MGCNCRGKDENMRDDPHNPWILPAVIVVGLFIVWVWDENRRSALYEWLGEKFVGKGPK